MTTTEDPLLANLMLAHEMSMSPNPIIRSRGTLMKAIHEKIGVFITDSITRQAHSEALSAMAWVFSLYLSMFAKILVIEGHEEALVDRLMSDMRKMILQGMEAE